MTDGNKDRRDWPLRTSEVLDAAADCVEHVGFCRGSYAKKADGTSATPLDPTATRWCGLGAIVLVAADTAAHGEAANAFGSLGGAVFNDDLNHTATDVAMALREAAARARENGR